MEGRPEGRSVCSGYATLPRVPALVEIVSNPYTCGDDDWPWRTDAKVLRMMVENGPTLGASRSPAEMVERRVRWRLDESQSRKVLPVPQSRVPRSAPRPPVAYGAAIAINTPDGADIDSVVLLRPCSMTHHTDAGQRYIKLPIVSQNATAVTAQGPADGNIAPPGHYMLFILNADAVPSEAAFVHVS